ncbi:CD225/dispanin family protein [Nonlabens sp. Ci31]|uniref:CD225/dispanin family protein n=1 Tax=Nonlabens sp. Ci31 TaxID=2608253 RepID=UPI001462908F|nr:CD225/dispanin family protein [Nonlabens sp. Ci31]QJP33133.1 CD225/dispanin family protein [Nonlabens sp. Ci31]
MEVQNQPQHSQQFNSGNASGPAPKTWLAESIIVTILCCQIFGIIAIIYSSQVESKHRIGDIQGALDSSRKAKNWVIAAVATGVVLIAVFFFTGILAAIADGGGF